MRYDHRTQIAAEGCRDHQGGEVCGLAARKEPSGPMLKRLQTLRAFGTGCVGLLLLHPSLPTQDFTSGVEILTVATTALDRDGKPIAGLGVKDFAVQLNHKPAIVRNVEFLRYGSSQETSTTPTVTPRAVPNRNSGRVFMLAVDDISSTIAEGRGLVAAMERNLSVFGSNDLVGLVTLSGLGPTVSPTRDRVVVAQALKSRGLFGKLPETPVLVTFKEAMEIASEVRGVAQAVSRRECSETRAGCDGGARMAAQFALAQGRRVEQQQLDAIAGLLDTMGSMPSPRILVLLTSGIPAGIDGHSKNRLRSILAAAAQHNVQVFTLTESLDTSDASLSLERARARYLNGEFMYSGMQEVTNAVGGKSFKVIGQADRFISRISDETSGIYQIGVEVPADAPRDRPIPITVRAVRPHVELSALTEVVLGSRSAEREPLAKRLKERLAQGGAAFGVPVSMGIAVHLADAKRIQLAFDLAVPRDVSGPLTVLFAAVDQKGAVVASGKKTIDATLPNDDYRVSTAISVPQGDGALRVVVADAGGNIGSVDRPFSARLFETGGLQSSSLYATWTSADGPSRFLAAEPMPRESRVVNPILELYGAETSLSKISVSFAATDQRGKTIYEERVLIAAGGVAKGTWRVGDMSPGPYSLTSIIRDGDRELRRETIYFIKRQ